MTIFNSYHYEPLRSKDEIRLLILDPAKNRTSPLRCSIVHHKLASQARTYSAVSYAWSDAKPTHALKITHGGGTSYLMITAIVDTLLRYFRAPREVRYLWIDAICLNQEDEIEKAHQIPVMGRIYKEATDVRIWLGVENVTTSTLYQFFREVSRGPELEQHMTAERVVSLMTMFFVDSTPNSAEDVMQPGCRLALVCLNAFFQNLWFSRRWIIQEAVLARKAIMKTGNYDITLGTFTMAARRLMSFDISEYSMKMAAAMSERAENSILMENLWVFHQLCLSFCDGFELNYKNSWEDIYKQVASSALRSGNKDIRIQVLLHLFEFGAVSTTPSLNYPPWVPDWSKRRKRELPYHSRRPGVDTIEEYPSFIAASDKVNLTLDDDTLHVQPALSKNGYRVWQVGCTISPGKSRSDSKQVICLLERLFPLCSDEWPWMIVELSSFVQYIGEFCDVKDEDTSAAFTAYAEQVLSKISESIDSRCLEALRWLSILIQDFCFCDLRPYGLADSPRRGFAIGPYGISCDDVMVPLWRRMEVGREGRFIMNSGARLPIEITTMLVVRYDEGTRRCLECGWQEDDGNKPRGRIIGPAICIEFGRNPGFEEDPMSEFTHGGGEGGFFVF